MLLRKLIWLTSLMVGVAAIADDRPNVLMILVDDLKPTLGCYGDSVAITPNMDRLAARGIRFENAYCNQAVCAPSRFTLMTGSHSTSSGLYGLNSRLREAMPDAMTLPQFFSKHGGYRTESLGKIFHIGHGNPGDPDSFDVPHFAEKVIEYVDSASTPGGDLTREEAYFSNQKLDRIASLPRGAAFESPDVADDAYADGRVATETVARLAAAKQRRGRDGTPFLIAVGFARPHLPFCVPKKYWDMYEPSRLPMPDREVPPDGAPPIAGKRGGEIRNYFPIPDKGDPASINDSLKRQLIHGYYASTSYVDRQIGKVIDGLDQLGLSDNTIVVLWGDHGFHLGDLGVWTKHTNYEQANRIPLLIVAPGVADPGSVTPQMAQSVDVYPTLAELAGLPSPSQTVSQPMDGQSLAPVLRDPTQRIRDHVYHVFPRPRRHLGRAVRTERYRLVQWRRPNSPREQDRYELYDYETDPLESKNHYAQRPKVAERLKSILDSYPPPQGYEFDRDTTSAKSGLTGDAKHRDDRKLIVDVGEPIRESDERSDDSIVRSKLVTEWGSRVTPDNAWQEYPRPQMRRDQWSNLNGLWSYAIGSAERSTPPGRTDGDILVPFCLESKLGGVQRELKPHQNLWYRRKFEVDKGDGRRTLLHFEAVDYRCEVYVNDRFVGSHSGGNLPFHFDITDAAVDGNNDLVVAVHDDTEQFQLRGKQTLRPRGIWYTRVSGIWQTVWTERVSPTHLTDLNIRTNAVDGSITIAPEVESRRPRQQIRMTVRDGDETIASLRGDGDELTIRLANAKLWSPSDPHLYDLTVEVIDAGGSVIDSVESYAGIREVGKTKDADGHWRFTLNGKTIFHWGPLDQGWWPDGLLTPPSDEAMRYDIEYLKRAGFNMIRKHIKVEPRRYYYHCDKIGMMVWQDQVSGGEKERGDWPEWTRLKPDPVDATWPDDAHQQFMDELDNMIDTLEDHPSIVCWVPFNERWGQHRTMEVGRWTVQRDPSRLVNVASGGNFWPVGDIVDAHHYPHPEFPFDQNIDGRFDPFVKVMGEFGGHGFPVQDHLWDADKRNWGYGDLPKTMKQFRERYAESLRKLNELRRRGIAAGVYTQTTDVEGEINGLMTYDRKVIKIPADELARMHQVLSEAAEE